MNILDWMGSAAWIAYGEHKAYSACAEEMKKHMDSDMLEVRAILDDAPEPSRDERGNWFDTTRRYVEALEEVVDDVLNPGEQNDNCMQKS